MKFKLIIKDNETGEVVIDTDFNGIVGGIAKDDDIVSNLALMRCTYLEAVEMINTAEKTIRRLLNSDRKLRLLYELEKELKREEKKK